jgi:hypothetical protein
MRRTEVHIRFLNAKILRHISGRTWQTSRRSRLVSTAEQDRVSHTKKEYLDTDAIFGRLFPSLTS